MIRPERVHQTEPKQRTNKFTKFFALGVGAVLVLIDQVLKYLMVTHLRLSASSKPIIPGLLQLTYVENSGAAFGLFRDRRLLLAVVVSIIIGVFLYFILSNKIKNPFVIWVSSIILAGGAGNLIDRFMRGFVVDYLDISPLFSFPVFNFADCLVVVGCILLMIYLIFVHKEVDESLIAIDSEEIEEMNGEN